MAQLKDQRQEVRVRTQMERNYVEHDSKMQLQIARKQRDMDRAVRGGLRPFSMEKKKFTILPWLRGRVLFP